MAALNLSLTAAFRYSRWARYFGVFNHHTWPGACSHYGITAQNDDRAMHEPAEVNPFNEVCHLARDCDRHTLEPSSLLAAK